MMKIKKICCVMDDGGIRSWGLYINRWAATDKRQMVCGFVLALFSFFYGTFFFYKLLHWIWRKKSCKFFITGITQKKKGKKEKNKQTNNDNARNLSTTTRTLMHLCNVLPYSITCADPWKTHVNQNWSKCITLIYNS